MRATSQHHGIQVSRATTCLKHTDEECRKQSAEEQSFAKRGGRRSHALKTSVMHHRSVVPPSYDSVRVLLTRGMMAAIGIIEEKER